MIQVVQEPASSAMYPNLKELLEALGRDLPPYLIIELRRRYDEHGWEYNSHQQHSDGRSINTCMTADSRQLAREEIVDAIWNLLVLNLKERDDWKTKGALQSCLNALTDLR